MPTEPRRVALLEREESLANVTALAARVADGSGSVLLVEGAPGIGKTAFLAEAAAIAETHGATRLAARGRELEREYPMGVVRQLFERPLTRLPAVERRQCLSGAAAPAGGVVGMAGTDEQPTTPFVVLHALYWLTSNLCERSPLCMVVDDVQWADRASVRFLAYLAHRLDELPLLLMIATRTSEAADESLDAIAAEPITRHEVLRPLTVSGVEELIGIHLPGRRSADFAGRCHRLSAGNPFLLGELLREVELSSGAGGDVDSLLPQGLPGIVARRLRALGPGAVAMARAVAVLDSDAQLRHATALAGLAPDAGAAAVVALSADDILAPGVPLDFRHPLIGAAVRADMTRAEWMARQRAAAAILNEARAPAERVVSHLLEAEPGAEPWEYETLRAAAAAGSAEGEVALVSACLRRALAASPPEADQAELRAALGRAALRAGEDDAVEQLEVALELAADPVARAEIARDLAVALTSRGEPAAAGQALMDAVADVRGSDRETALRLEAEVVALAAVDVNVAPMAEGPAARAGELQGVTAAERVLLAALAYRNMVTGRWSTAADVVETAHRALGDGALLREHSSDGPTFYQALAALIVAEEIETATRLVAMAEDDARKRGSGLGLTLAAYYRSLIAHHEGAVAEAEQYARSAVELSVENGWAGLRPYAVAALTFALVDDDDLDAAHAELSRLHLRSDEAAPPAFDYLLHARAYLRFAQRRYGEARSDLRIVELRERQRASCGVGLQWRPLAAQVLEATGEPEAARAVIRDHVELAQRWGRPRAIGVALWVQGRLEGGAEGRRTFERALGVLAPSSARLDEARCRVELGAALRRANQRAEGRRQILAGLELAHACGATGLVRRAAHEARATGARPRRMALSGVDALTASESRIARLAADGLSNKAIAQELFVTVKAVEGHLSSVYRKLSVTSRHELPAALEPPER